MNNRVTYMVLLLVLLAGSALPAAASESEAVNLPGWLGAAMVLVALLLPLLVWSRLRSRGQL
jgi:hypothetical protein